MLRLVVDTNVIISSLWGGKPRELLDLWQANLFSMLISREILEEYLTVLQEFDLSGSDMKRWENLFMRKTLVIKPKKTLKVVREDETDNRFLECAVEGKADFLVSGDKHLLKLREHDLIPIVRVTEILGNISKRA